MGWLRDETPSQDGAPATQNPKPSPWGLALVEVGYAEALKGKLAEALRLCERTFGRLP